MKVKEKGDLQNPLDAPTCDAGQRIELISYIYQKKECTPDLLCAIIHEESFTPEAEINLHEMCSLQQNCPELTFPYRSDVQKNKTDAVLLRYRCLGK